ncbi:MAG: sigma-70 family RNA polymerase sigma factor, partial [Candidatus Sumerlaeia bacterium]|nr:sigma-70 family RNA polymerase sigma factor [Candidatus Sumerlaeia bacterium]
MKQKIQDAWEVLKDREDETAFAVLFAETRALVYTICYRISIDAEDTEEAFQATYARLLSVAEDAAQRIHVYDARAFIQRIAVREADALRKRHLRRSQREVSMEHVPEATNGAMPPCEVAIRNELRGKLEAYVATLPEKTRLPVQLHYFNGMTHEEIAVALNVPRTTVTDRIRRGLYRLHPMLKRAGLGDAATAFGAVAGSATLLAPPAKLSAASHVFASAKFAAPSLHPINIASVMTTPGTLSTLGASKVAATICLLTIAAVLVVLSFLPENTPTGEEFLIGSGETKAPTGMVVPAATMEPSLALYTSADALEELTPQGRVIATNGAEESGPHFTGRVVENVTGIPIPGARVEKIRFSGNHDFGRPARISESCETDDHGRFRMALKPSNTPEVEIAEGLLALRAFAEGYESRLYVFNFPSVNPEDELVMMLGPGANISGYVRNAAGRGIAGATLGGLLLERPRGRGAEGTASAISADVTSDANGFFLLAGMQYDSEVEIPVRAEGYGSLISEPIKAGTEGAVIILQEADGRISGSVLTSDGHPASDQQVWLTPLDGIRLNEMQSLFTIRTVITNEAGEFEQGSLEPGSYYLQVVRGNTELASELLELEMGEEKAVTLTLPPPIDVTVRFVEVLTGSPVPDVKLSIGRQVNQSDAVKSDLNGMARVRVENPQGMAYIAYLPPPGLGGVDKQDGINCIHLQNARDFVETPFVIELEPTSVVTGVVVGPDGSTPVSGARISVYRQTRWDHFSATSDPVGKFEITINPGGTAKLLASSDAGIGSCDLASDASAQPVIVKLEKWASVSGRVTDADGNPVSAIPLYGVVSSETHNASHGTPNAITNSEGYYYMEQLPAGTNSIQVQFIREQELLRKYSQPEPISIELEPGDYRRNVDFVLYPSSTMSLLVVTESGEPVVRALIWLNAIRSGVLYDPIQLITDVEGKAELEGVQQGDTIRELAVMHPKYDTQTLQNINVQEEELRVTLQKRGAVNLVVKDEAGHAVGRIAWKSSSDPLGKAIHVEAHSGRYLLEDQAKGTHEISVSEIDLNGELTGRGGSKRVHVTSGETTEAEIVVSGGRRLSGVVVMTGDGKEPVEGAIVSTTGGIVGGSTSVTTDREGAFVFDLAKPGVHRLNAVAEGLMAVDATEITIIPGQDPEPISIRMANVGRVHGRIIGIDGKPVEGARLALVRLADGHNIRKSALTDAEGRYSFVAELAGDHLLELQRGPRNPRRNAAINIRPGEDFEKDFDFSSIVTLMGNISVNDMPFDASNYLHVSFTQLDGISQSYNAGAERRGGAKYDVLLWPGIYRIDFHDQRRAGNGTKIGEVTVYKTPAEQTHDIDIELVDAGVALVFPTKEDFAPGTVIVAQPAESEQDMYRHHQRIQATKPEVLLPALPPGIYTATFLSQDGKWQGSSEAIELRHGADNVLIIELRRPSQRVPIGEWRSEDLGNDWRSFEFAASPHIENPGEYLVSFLYQTGIEGLKIRSVTLLENGIPISHD